MIALWRRANARNVSFVTLYGVQLTLSTRSITSNYPLPLHHSFFRNLPSIVMQMNTVCFVAQSLTTYVLICFYSFTYMTTDGAKGLFLTQKWFVRHHFYWLRKWQSRSVFVRMVTLQRFFALLIKKGLNYCAMTMIIQLTIVFSFCLSFFCQTFLTLSLSDMANRVQLSSPKEAEQYILNMVTTFTLCL